MNEQLLADFLEDRDRLSDEQFSELLSAVQTNPALAEILRQSLMMDDLLSRTVGSHRGNFHAQVALRLQDAGTPSAARRGAIQKKLIRTEDLPSQGGVAIPLRKARLFRFSWILAAAASVAIIAGVYWLRPVTGLGLRVAEVSGECSVFSVQYSEGVSSASGVLSHESSKGVPAVVGMEMRQGDRVVVGIGGMARLKYDGEETKIELRDATVAAFGSEKGAKRVRLDGGKFVCSAAPQKMPFQIKTPHAVARVVGTRFSLDVTDPRTRLAVIEGNVALCQGEKILLVSAGEMATATETGMALGTGTTVTEPQSGTPVSEIRFGDMAMGRQMFRRLWWDPRDMTLEGEESPVHDGVTGLFRWSLAGPTNKPASFLGRTELGSARHLIRLADGRLLGLNAPWSPIGPLPECGPVELQPQARRMGPGVAFDASSVKMTACDTQGRYFMTAMRAQNANGGGRVLIWDLKGGVLAADLKELPTQPHSMGDFGFTACAVAPDAGLGVVVDSGGGLLVLDLPKGAVRHRLALPMPQNPQPYGLDLVWEKGELICHGWPSLVETIRVNPVTGVILERFDHPVIRCEEMTIHVRGNEIEIVRQGAVATRVSLPPIKWGVSSVPAAAGVGGWRCSPDGRWLAGTVGAGVIQALVDLQEGRCVSPEK